MPSKVLPGLKFFPGLSGLEDMPGYTHPAGAHDAVLEKIAARPRVTNLKRVRGEYADGADDSHCSKQFAALETALIARFQRPVDERRVITQRPAHTRRPRPGRLAAGKLG